MRKNRSLAAVWKSYYILSCMPGSIPDLEKSTGFHRNSIRAWVHKFRGSKPKMAYIGEWRPVTRGGRSTAIFYAGDQKDAPYSHFGKSNATDIEKVAEREANMLRMRGLREKYKKEGSVPRMRADKPPKPTKEDAFLKKLRDCAEPANPFSTLFQLQGLLVNDEHKR